MPDEQEKEQRHGIRFGPGGDNIARIDPHALKESFAPKINALVIDEAKDGYKLVVVNIDRLNEGQICKVKVGKFPPIDAEVIWIKEVEPQVFALGIKIVKSNP